MPRQRRHTRRRRQKRIPWGWLAWLTLLIALLAIYFRGGLPYGLPGSTMSPGRTINLVESSQKPVTAGTPGWEYQRTLKADLNGDASEETIVVLARVSRVPGRTDVYQWDDGQPWQIYVQDGPNLTHIYSRYVQLGQLNVFITDEQPARVGIAENQGAGYGLYAVTYVRPGQVRAVELAKLPLKDKIW